MNLPAPAKVGIGWVIVTAVGIYAFVLSKRSVNAKRYENMKARQRMQRINTED